jgi:hypothetical protein
MINPYPSWYRVDVGVYILYPEPSPRIKWCQEFVGEKSENWNITYDADITTFYFKTKEHAIMFTLKFA